MKFEGVPLRKEAVGLFGFAPEEDRAVVSGTGGSRHVCEMVSFIFCLIFAIFSSRLLGQSLMIVRDEKKNWETDCCVKKEPPCSIARRYSCDSIGYSESSVHRAGGAALLNSTTIFV